MDSNKNFTPIFSKPLILALIIVAIIWAAVVIWIPYSKKPAATNTTTDTSDSINIDNTAATDNAPSANNAEIDDEINSLDQSIANVNDNGLSDTGYSDSDLGIE